MMEVSWFFPQDKSSEAKHVELFVVLMSHILDIVSILACPCYS
jgi:hypothetical protein